MQKFMQIWLVTAACISVCLLQRINEWLYQFAHCTLMLCGVSRIFIGEKMNDLMIDNRLSLTMIDLTQLQGPIPHTTEYFEVLVEILLHFSSFFICTLLTFTQGFLQQDLNGNCRFKCILKGKIYLYLGNYSESVQMEKVVLCPRSGKKPQGFLIQWVKPLPYYTFHGGTFLMINWFNGSRICLCLG